MSNVVKDLFTFVAGATRSLTTAVLRFLSGYDKNSRFHFAAAASFTVFEHIQNFSFCMKYQKLLLVFSAVILISGCETMGGSSSSSSSPSYAYGDSKQADLQAYLQNEIGDRVYFETNKHNISSAAAYILESQANWIKSTPGFQLIVEGHCDERGTREYNLALGERRANAVKEFLVSKW